MIHKILNFIDKIYSLRTITRYNNSLRIKNESVAEHSFFVSIITLNLHNYYNFDLLKALKMSIVHDVPEQEINDIPHNTKRNYPELKEILKSCELRACDKIDPMLKPLIIELDECLTPEALIVSLADVLSCLQYSKSELTLGNSGYIKTVYEESVERSTELFNQLEKYKR